MYITLIIFLTTYSGILCITYLFVRSNRTTVQEHKHTLAQVKHNLAMHRLQVCKRAKLLNKYHLLKYNLDEALISQPEIIL